MILEGAFEDVQQYKKLCNFFKIKDNSKCVQWVTTPLPVFADGATWCLGRWCHNFGTIISIIKKTISALVLYCSEITCVGLLSQCIIVFFHPTFFKQLNIDVYTPKGHRLAVTFLHDTYYFPVHSCFLSPKRPSLISEIFLDFQTVGDKTNFLDKTAKALTRIFCLF